MLPQTTHRIPPLAKWACMLPSARQSWHDAVLRVALERHVLRPKQVTRVLSLLDHGLDLSQLLIGSGLMTPDVFDACVQAAGAQEYAFNTDQPQPLRAYEAGGHVLMHVLEDVQGPVHEHTHGSLWPAVRARQIALQQMLPSQSQASSQGAHPLLATQAWRMSEHSDEHMIIEGSDAETDALLEPLLQQAPSLEELRAGMREANMDDRRPMHVIYAQEDGRLSALLLLGYRVCVHTDTRADSNALIDALTALGHHAMLYRRHSTPHGSAWLVVRI